MELALPKVLRTVPARRVRVNLAAIRARPRAVRSCSQTRNTRQPRDLRIPRTRLSLAMLSAIFLIQNPRFDFGVRRCVGHPCQKHPSTNTTTRSPRKTKSGLPGSVDPRRQPFTPAERSRRAIDNSVESLPRPRTRAICAERSDGVNWSISRVAPSFSGPASSPFRPRGRSLVLAYPLFRPSPKSARGHALSTHIRQGILSIAIPSPSPQSLVPGASPAAIGMTIGLRPRRGPTGAQAAPTRSPWPGPAPHRNSRRNWPRPNPPQNPPGPSPSGAGCGRR